MGCCCSKASKPPTASAEAASPAPPVPPPPLPSPVPADTTEAAEDAWQPMASEKSGGRWGTQMKDGGADGYKMIRSYRLCHIE